MYYIIETQYVGPNQDQDQYVDVDRVEISTSPAVTNSSREECTEGWCGTTNDWAVYAHGEYATIEEALAAVAEKFGEVRDADAAYPDSGIVETYKLGKYTPMGIEETSQWAYAGFSSEINAGTTDDRITELVAEWEGEANSEGWTLDSSLENNMKVYRQELRDDPEDEAGAAPPGPSMGM